MPNRIALVVASFVVALALGALVPAVDAAPAPIPVVDLHVDLSYRVNFRGGSLAAGSGQYVASKLVNAGVSGVVLPLYVPRDVSPTGPRMVDLDDSLTHLLALIPRTPPFRAPGCADPAGGVRTWFAFEGAAPLADDPDSIPRWVARGVRLFGLVHSYDNALATSSGTSPPPTTGLTDKGRDVVRRIQRAGGILDVSHASDAATDDILALAEAAHVPVVATHSDARALAPHPRNLNDAQIRRIAATGGVIGVNFHSRFLAPHGKATLADVVRQVDYLVHVAGIDHVAIGSDFEGDITPPRELTDVSGFPHLAAALIAHGMSRPDVTKVFSGNALRVLCPPAK
jgi:membrane dipeptidase